MVICYSYVDICLYVVPSDNLRTALQSSSFFVFDINVRKTDKKTLTFGRATIFVLTFVFLFYEKTIPKETRNPKFLHVNFFRNFFI